MKDKIEKFSKSECENTDKLMGKRVVESLLKTQNKKLKKKTKKSNEKNTTGIIKLFQAFLSIMSILLKLF